MIKTTSKLTLSTIYIIFLAISLATLVWFALTYKLIPASYYEPSHLINEVLVTLEGQTAQAVTLPTKINNLAPVPR